MIWENWLVAISVGIIALAFVALVIFVILALISIKQMLNDVDQKIHSLDPLFRIVSKAGNVMEKKAVKQLSEVEERVSEEREYQRSHGVNTAMEIAEWALIGLALWQKFKDKRR